MQVRSVASVSFALTVLRQHCQSFQIHAEVKGQPRLKRAALDQAVRCYYHSGPALASDHDIVVIPMNRPINCSKPASWYMLRL